MIEFDYVLQTSINSLHLSETEIVSITELIHSENLENRDGDNT